ncbi:mitotic-spindle organizing protein 2-like [Halichondria panicea]|uniref:mitotic-spindle organizing protein 2-like n=1 Tax=Halichondria panicea TaxID=6063 RepID=UPI00312B9DBA
MASHRSTPTEEGKKYSYSASSFKIKTNEEELFELVQLSEVPVDKELFKVLLELLKMNIAPVAILQVLKSLKSPHSTVLSSEPLKPSRDHSKPPSSKSHPSKSSKKPSAPKEPSSSNQDHKRSSSKNSSRGSSSQKRTVAPSGSSSVRKEKTTPKT